MPSNSIRAILSDIPETTSVHGILQISKSKRGCKFCWIAIFCVCLSTCLYGCVRNIQEYLKFDIKTTERFQNVENLSMPEILFCSPNNIKRSQIGNWSLAPWFLTSILGRNMDKRILEINNRTCKSSTLSPFIEMIEKLGIVKFFKNDELTRKYFFNQVWINYQSDVVKCWWNDNELDCDKYFLSKFADDRLCFSFNTGLGTDQMLQRIKGNNLNNTDNTHARLPTSNSTRNTARLLLNVNQSEYCGSDFIKLGAGYFIYFNQPDGTLFTSLNQPTYLHPGYSHNVIIKPANSRRHTENLRRCTTVFQKFNIFQSIVAKYSQSLCIYQELIILMLIECHCLPGHAVDFFALFLNSSETLGINRNHMLLCNVMEDINIYTCIRNIQTKYIVQSSFASLFPHCQEECSKTEYDIQITSSRLPISTLKHDLKTFEFVADEKILRKNFLYVSFTLERNVHLFDEYQDVSIKDLFISLGNNIGLFMGMSFTTVFELNIQIILRCLMLGIKHSLYSLRTYYRNMKTGLFTIGRSRKNSTKKKRKKRHRKRIIANLDSTIFDL